MRARWIVGAFVLGAAGLFAATRQRVIATTFDGTFRVLAVGYGTEFEYRKPRFASFPRLFPTSELVTVPVPALGVNVGCADARVYSVALVAQCGCRFRWTDPPDASALNSDLLLFQTFPRRGTTLRLQFDGSPVRTAAFDLPVPVAAPASADGVEDLPVVTRVDGETWVLSPDPQDTRSVVVRAVGADRSGFAWAYRGAWFADASGNRVNRQSDGFTTREHRISIPTTAPGSGYRLCPHEPWWELTVELSEAKSVTFRFRPPR